MYPRLKAQIPHPQNFTSSTIGNLSISNSYNLLALFGLADRTAVLPVHAIMIGDWHDNVVCPSMSVQL